MEKGGSEKEMGWAKESGREKGWKIEEYREGEYGAKRKTGE